MENVADALKMAFAVLSFVVALSIAMSSFSQVREVSQVLIEANDDTYNYKYVEQNVDSSGNLQTERIVGVETIIPSIYRAFQENYKVIFIGKNGYVYNLYTLNPGTIEEKTLNIIDAEEKELTLASDEFKEKFILGILYSTSKLNDIYGDTVDYNKYFAQQKIRLNSTGLYDIIKNKRYKESIGIYYQEDLSDGTSSPTDPDYTEGEVPLTNKTPKRIITYTEI